MNLIEKIFGKNNLNEVEFPLSDAAKRHFEETWEIAESFEKIKNQVRKMVMQTLVKMLENERSRALCVYDKEDFLSGEKGKPLRICSYATEDGLDYVIESEEPNFKKLKYGIKCNFECNSLEELFNRELRENELKVLKEFLPQYNSLKDLKLEIIYALPDKDWKIEEGRWLAVRYFDDFYGNTTKKEFFMEILEKGDERVAQYYYEKIEKLIIDTENATAVYHEIFD